MARYFTGTGDAGSSTFFGSAERLPKDDPRFEALGAIDELNSYLGVCRSYSTLPDITAAIEQVQQDLFILQSEIGSARRPPPHKMTGSKTEWLEGVIASFGPGLGDIRTFIVPGGDALSAHLDYARTLARAAERRCVPLKDALGPHALSYVNRLSSALFVLARSANKAANMPESGPSYR